MLVNIQQPLQNPNMSQVHIMLHMCILCCVKVFRILFVDSCHLQWILKWFPQRITGVRETEPYRHWVLCLETTEPQQCAYNCSFSTLPQGVRRVCWTANRVSCSQMHTCTSDKHEGLITYIVSTGFLLTQLYSWGQYVLWHHIIQVFKSYRLLKCWSWSTLAMVLYVCINYIDVLQAAADKHADNTCIQ
jgi:hypothetical protein